MNHRNPCWRRVTLHFRVFVFLIGSFLIVPHAFSAPALDVVRPAPGRVRILWAYPAPGYVLQSTADLTVSPWADVVAPVQVDGERQFVDLPTLGMNRFFRLRSGCLDLREYAPGRVPNPWQVAGMVLAVQDADGGLLLAGQILSWGGWAGLDVGRFLQVDFREPCWGVQLTLHAGGSPITVNAYDAEGGLVQSVNTEGATTSPVVAGVSGAGREIVRLLLDAPEGRTLLLSLCGQFGSEPPGGYYNPFGAPEDPFNVIHFVSIDKEGVPGDFRQRPVPPENIYRQEDRPERKEDDFQPVRPSKISPVLLEWLATHDPREVVEILVTLPEDMPVPLLPDLGPNESRERGVTRRGEVIRMLQDTRLEAHKRTLERLRQFVHGDVFEPMESFWIVNTLALRMELGAVPGLAESEEVMYLQPVEGGEKPPADGNSNNDLLDGRSRIVSDPYFNLGLTAPWIGLLDTGVRDTHVVFNSPRHIAWMRDCVNGGPDCNDTSNPNFDPTDFAWDHGTSSAGIITGNDRLGNAFRGATEVRLDSWQIYTAAGLNSGAAVRAIQAGIAAFDKVLVGEIQANETETGAIATAADNAYNAGVIFVSANGNFGPDSGTVRSPGIAHKVLGVGGFMTDGGAQYNNQGRGPATDGRYKPDIQAPTWSETASAASDNALQVFTGTSGATPYAAAAAMLARNWLRQFGIYDNGQTYAFMILYGQNPWPYDNTEGAGRLGMAVNGHAWWGKVSVANLANVDIPIGIGSGKRDFDAALWWPESAAQLHNDIDVHLIDPFGTERARGYSGVSVFERARVGGSLTAGTWTVRIRGYSVRTGTQVVYWAAHAQNN